MRAFKLSAAFLFFLAAASVARAEVLTYDLTLTPTNPFNVLGAGTGHFSIVVSPDQASNDQMGFFSVYTLGTGLFDFAVTIAGETYTPQSASVQLQGNGITALNFDSISFTPLDDLFLDSDAPPGEGFSLLREVGTGIDATIESENGDFTIVQVTPEPGSFLLVATGLVGALGMAYRRSSLLRHSS